VQALDSAASNAYYVPSSDGPCFFDRLEDKTEPSTSCVSQAVSPSGFITLVNTRELAEQGLEVDSDASVIDYYYFNATRTPGLHVNESMLAWLTLDAVHAAVYGVVLEP